MKLLLDPGKTQGKAEGERDFLGRDGRDVDPGKTPGAAEGERDDADME